MTLERKEYWQRLSQDDWPKLAASLWLENGLWPDYEAPVVWRLDGSEGPLRMRCVLTTLSRVLRAKI